jgi:hypothetical protein
MGGADDLLCWFALGFMLEVYGDNTFAYRYLFGCQTDHISALSPVANWGCKHGRNPCINKDVRLSNEDRVLRPNNRYETTHARFASGDNS